MNTRRQSMFRTTMSEKTSLCNMPRNKLANNFKSPSKNVAIIVSDHSSFSCLGVTSSSGENNELLSPIRLKEFSSNTKAVLAPDTPEGTVYGLEARLLSESVLADAMATGIVSVMETPESIDNNISASKCTPLNRLSRRTSSQTLYQTAGQNGTASSNGDEIS